MKYIWIHGIYAAAIIALVIAALSGVLDPLRDSAWTSIRNARDWLLISTKCIRLCCLNTVTVAVFRSRVCIVWMRPSSMGWGAKCDCMSDIMNGRQPCSEYVGGILLR